MRNSHTQLKHTEIGTEYCGLFAFLPGKGIFSYLSAYAIPHCPSAAHTTWEPSSLVPQGLAQGPRGGGKCLHGGVLKWIRAYTPRHHRPGQTDENTHRYHENNLSICFHLGLFSWPLSFSAHTSVQYMEIAHGPDQTLAALGLAT